MLSLLLAIFFGWAVWKYQDITKEKNVVKIEEENTLLSENQYIDSLIILKLEQLEEVKEKYNHAQAINQTLHNQYLNSYEIFKKETIKNYHLKKEKDYKIWADKEVRRKTRKQEYARKHLDNWFDND